MKRLLWIAGTFLALTTLLLAVAIISFVSRTSSEDKGRAVAGDHAEKGAEYLKHHLYKAAIREFEAATKRSPGALDPWLGLASVYIRLGDGPKALEGAARAADIARDSIVAQLILGRAHWLARNLDEAEKAALRVRDLDRANLQAAELLLSVYSERRDEAKFRNLFDSIKEPNGAINDLAVQFALRRSEFRRAYDLQTRFDQRKLEGDVLRTQLALKREPERQELYPELIRNLVTIGRAKEAVAAVRQYRGRISVDLEAGKAYWLDGNRPEAIRAFERASAGVMHKLPAEAALAAITGDPRHWYEAFKAELLEKDYFVLAQLEDLMSRAEPLEKAFIYRFAGLFDMDLFNESARQALEVLKNDPEQFDALMTIGTAYLRLGRFDDAMRYVRQGSDKFGDRAEVSARLGQLYLLKGDLASAGPMLEKAARQAPSSASYLYNYGWLLDQLDRDAEAIPYYRRAIDASPFSFEAMNNLALLETAAGRPDSALSLLDRAAQSNPENDAALMNRGAYYAGRRAWREALEDYGRAAELNPGNAFAWVESARTHLELGRVSLAIEDLDRALNINPNIADAYVLLASAYQKNGRAEDSAAALEEAKRIEGPQSSAIVTP